MKPQKFPLVSRASTSSAKPGSRRAAAQPMPVSAAPRESVADDWTPADYWAMQSTSLAIAISIVRNHEKRGDCDPKVRESLMAIKLQIDRAIRNAEHDGIYRKATADMPLDLD